MLLRMNPCGIYAAWQGAGRNHNFFVGGIGLYSNHAFSVDVKNFNPVYAVGTNIKKLVGRIGKEYILEGFVFDTQTVVYLH